MPGTVIFQYSMSLSFDGAVKGHHYTLKCLPKSTLRQEITALETTLLPKGQNWESSDAFGNRELLGVLTGPHDHFSVQMRGEAVLSLPAPDPYPYAGDAGTSAALHGCEGRNSNETNTTGHPCKAQNSPCEGCRTAGQQAVLSADGILLYPEERIRADKLGIYRYPTTLTRPGAQILEYYRNLVAAGGNTELDGRAARKEAAAPAQQAGAVEGSAPAQQAELAVQLMHRLHCDMTYQKAATDVNTTAEAAMEKRTGVCQDYAQIYIALLRLCGIPARYVTGMLRGEGESHAWAEAAISGYWYGLDPTNDCAVAGDHVRIACGRDFADCRISQGVFYGGTRQEQQIRVVVEDAAAAQ